MLFLQVTVNEKFRTTFKHICYNFYWDLCYYVHDDDLTSDDVSSRAKRLQQLELALNTAYNKRRPTQIEKVCLLTQSIYRSTLDE